MIGSPAVHSTMPVPVSPSIDVTKTPIGATWLRSATGS